MFSRFGLFLMLGAAWLTSPAWAQTCQPHIPESTNLKQFQINTNGTVFDKKSGLTWKQCVEGLEGSSCSQGNLVFLSWESALQHAAASTFAGFDDWRLPNIKELMSLAEDQCATPSIKTLVFPNTPADLHWSATPYANDSSVTWYADFDTGFANYRNSSRGNTYVVRLVRGEP
jgi:hypothetical protein